MKNTSPQRLRRRLLIPLAATFALVWLGTMVLLTKGAYDEMNRTVQLDAQSNQDYMEQEWELYKENLENGLGEDADSILRERLSSHSMSAVSDLDGGTALAAVTGSGKGIRSQLAWGSGYEGPEGENQRWFLDLDSGLDDEGQIDLARQIVQERNGWDYAIYPPESDFPGVFNDGTFARVTGLEKPGHTLAVQRIELIRPDGSTYPFLETDLTGGPSVTVDLVQLNIKSVLLPSWNSEGPDGSVDMPERLSNYRKAQDALTRQINGESRSVWYPGGFILGHTGASGLATRYVSVQCRVLYTTIQQQMWFYFSTFLLAAVVLLYLANRLSKQVTQPVEALCLQVQEGLCQTDGSLLELNTLAQAFNASQEKLAQQLQREREFTRAAAHELKTPLAVLRTHAEALKEDIDPAKREQYLDILLQESDRMAQLVSGLLELYRLESGATFTLEPVDLGGMVHQAFERLSLDLQGKGITLSADLPNLWVMGNPIHLEHVVDNLATNALRYCPAQGSIRAGLEQEGEMVSLWIYNDSPPISQEDLPHLFEPFYRGDKSRSREMGGSGLGLAIVRAAIQAHGGTCGVENVPDGLLFWITLQGGCPSSEESSQVQALPPEGGTPPSLPGISS